MARGVPLVLVLLFVLVHVHVLVLVLVLQVAGGVAPPSCHWHLLGQWKVIFGRSNGTDYSNWTQLLTFWRNLFEILQQVDLRYNHGTGLQEVASPNPPLKLQARTDPERVSKALYAIGQFLLHETLIKLMDYVLWYSRPPCPKLDHPAQKQLAQQRTLPNIFCEVSSSDIEVFMQAGTVSGTISSPSPTSAPSPTPSPATSPRGETRWRSMEPGERCSRAQGTFWG